MTYVPSKSFADHNSIQGREQKCNKEAQYTQSKKRICKNHPSSPWGKDQFGNWFPQCYYGHTTGTACELLKEENGVASDIVCECGEYGIKRK